MVPRPTFFQEAASSPQIEEMPPPPYLVIRDGVSFWVESRPLHQWSVTLHAFNQGCFQGACCYDADGGLWSIVKAEWRERPSLLNRLFPWRQAGVELRLGPCARVEIGNIVLRLAAILKSVSAFTEDALAAPPDAIIERFEGALTPLEIIQVAKECLKR